MKIFIKIFISLFWCITVFSCRSGEDRSLSAESPFKIVRLDRVARDYKASEEQPDSLARGTELLLELLKESGSPVTDFEEYSQSRLITVFQPDIESRLGELDSVEMVLATVIDRLHESFPKVKIADIYGIVTPYRQSVIVSDSIILLGLNHYLGSDYPGYSSFDSYSLYRKNKSMIPVEIAEAALSLAYPYLPDEESTVLSRMLYEGALLNAVTEVVPEVTVGMLLGYDDDQLKMVSTNESRIWQTLIERKLLYSNDPMDAARLMNPAPATGIISASLPGMAGRYIGYQIIKSYLTHNPDKSLADMLSPDFYNSQSALIDARYVPHL